MFPGRLAARLKRLGLIFCSSKTVQMREPRMIIVNDGSITIKEMTVISYAREDDR